MSDIADLIQKHAEGVELKLTEQKQLIDAVREHMTQLEAKAEGGGGPVAAPNFGSQLVKSEKFAAFKASGFQGNLRFGIDQKAITAAQSGTAWSQRDPESQGMARRAYRVRDLLNVVPTSSGSVDYARQTTRTNNAAVVAEGATKPTSTYVWEQKNVPVRTIAHLAKLTRQALDDAAQLQGEVESEMRYGLGLAEDTELLSGDNTGQHLDGLITNATAFSAPFDPAGTETMIDTIGLAVLQQSLTEYPSDGVIMHPSDWMRIRLLKDAAGMYLLGDPRLPLTPQLWGLPVALTQAMTIDKFMVGGFKLQKLYDRMAPEVLIASENSDDFEKNLYTMRCEERLALAVRVPSALIYGDFGNV